MIANGSSADRPPEYVLIPSIVLLITVVALNTLATRCATVGVQ